MSHAGVHGVSLLSRSEQDNLDRLQSLAADLPAASRPAVREAAEILLDVDRLIPPEGIPVKPRGRSFRLLPRRVFQSNGEATAAVELFVLRDEDRESGGKRLIRKRIERRALDFANIGWLSEALFYLDVAPQLACEGIKVPMVYGCRADGGGVTLVKEFLGKRPEEMHAANRLCSGARAIGRLGAYTHLHALHERPWVERVSPRFKAEALMALPDLVRGSLPGPEGDHCLEAIEAFIDNPQLHHTLSEQGIACLAHGDFHPWNVIPQADGHVGIIDWSCVGLGLIGEDVARLMLPHFVSDPLWADQPDFAEAVRGMTEEVIAGAKSILPSLDAERVRIAVIRSLLLAIPNVAGQAPDVSKQKLADGDEIFRAKLQSVFRFAAENARQFAARFGG